MKKKKIILVSALSVVLLAAAVTAYIIVTRYVLHDGYKQFARHFEPGASGEINEVKTELKVNGMSCVAENEKNALYADVKTGMTAVLDKASGTLYRSNPEGNTETKGEVYSQLRIEYYDAARKLQNMNSYTDCSAKNQITAEGIENGIRFIYLLGDTGKVDIEVPLRISSERLESFLSLVSAKDAETVRSKYHEVKGEEGMLELLESANKKLTLSKMDKILKSAGYTSEDYALDMMEDTGKETVTFTIPVDYRLTENGFEASIVTSAIKETGGAKLYNVQLLNYFLSADENATGYFVVPNGSGSVINFNNGKTSYAYSQYVYDMDPLIKSFTVIENNEPARLPVYGICFNDQNTAVMGVISKGESLARIEANVSGKNTRFNNIYTTFFLRGYEMLNMFGVSGTQADLPVVETTMCDCELAMEYSFLSGDDADYSGIARAYRNRLVGEGILKAKEENHELPFYLDILGNVDKKKDVAGIQYMGTEELTTFEEAAEIAEKLRDGGVSNIKMNYLGWFNGGYYHDVADRIKVESSLGGVKGFEKLQSELKENGDELYPNVAFLKVSENSKRYSLGLETAKYFTGKAVVLGEVSPFALRIGTDVAYEETNYAILSPKFVDRYVNSFVSKIADYDSQGIALRDLGSILASDKKRQEPISRETAKNIVDNAFETIAQTGRKLIVYGGNAYSLKYADAVLEAPVSDSDYSPIDYEIPFYEMVLHGYIDYAGAPLNLSQYSNRSDILLKALEYGIAPHYVLSYESSAKIKYTGLNSFCSTEYLTWEAEAEKLYTEASKALKGLTNKAIDRFDILSNGVHRVTYSDGTKIYVNYTDEAYETEGITVKAHDYVRREK